LHHVSQAGGADSGIALFQSRRSPDPDLVNPRNRDASKALRQPRYRLKRTLYGRIIMGRGILLWLLGVPIPVIILLALIWH
jgi:hypothetical protein